MPLVSVVMPVYNSEKYVAEAIESILSQTFTDLELIIVDDGSQDGSAAIIQQYAEGDRRIRFIQLEANRGVGFARNAGLAAAGGEYFTGQDSDDISLPERLRKQVSFLQSHPEVGVVGVHTRVVNERKQPKFDREPPVSHALIVLNHFTGVPAFTHCTLMIRRRLMLEAGGYDETLRYSEDSDLMTGLLGRMQFANIAEHLYLRRQYTGSLMSHDNPKKTQDMLLMRKRRLERIWAEAPMETWDRLSRLRPFSKLSWRERRAAKSDIICLIDAMIAAEWVEANERPLLLASINRLLEGVSPRLWQMFCHWRRRRFGGKNSDVNPL